MIQLFPAPTDEELRRLGEALLPLTTGAERLRDAALLRLRLISREPLGLDEGALLGRRVATASAMLRGSLPLPWVIDLFLATLHAAGETPAAPDVAAAGAAGVAAAHAFARASTIGYYVGQAARRVAYLPAPADHEPDALWAAFTRLHEAPWALAARIARHVELHGEGKHHSALDMRVSLLHIQADAAAFPDVLSRDLSRAVAQALDVLDWWSCPAPGAEPAPAAPGGAP